MHLPAPNAKPRGHGFGLRPRHYGELLSGGSGVPIVEATTENFLGRGGRPRAVLERVRQDSDVILHGVSLSVGGVDPLRYDYLRALRALAREIQAAWISDHLCFGTVGGHFAHDLWPLPYTEEALEHVVARVQVIQEHLGERIALENVSSYVAYAASEMTEWEFLAEVANRADCHLLVDVNNVYVSAENHGFDPSRYLQALPQARIRELHVAGHLRCAGYLLDDHGSAVSSPVWELFREAVRRFGHVPTIVEWDDNVPTLDELRAEAERALCIEAETLEGAGRRVSLPSASEGQKGQPPCV